MRETAKPSVKVRAIYDMLVRRLMKAPKTWSINNSEKMNKYLFLIILMIHYSLLICKICW